ncbi:hypothetical protein BVRB_9g223930 [Beta vulgaris subsp. vulgaris]|nr:hypothetical protein BVRB_9g223930 [Beta vulgaris subsp. vulgaris]
MATVSVFSAAARRLEGKVALITGGASGIGECAAKFFTKHGAKVMIADVQDDMGQSVWKDLGSSVASYIHCDVTNEAHVQNAVDSTMAQYQKLDIMFNNAGIVGSTKPNILDNSHSEFEQVLKVNLVGPFLGTKHAARVMILAKRGISNIYSNLKGVSCKVEDVANAALFLASDDSKFISGHNLVVDGGFTIMNPGFCMFEQLK